MDIASIGSRGLAATGTAITKAQERFDDTAEALVDSTVDDGTGGGDLIGNAVAMQSESITNQILYRVFARQAEQQKSLTDLISPTSR